MAAPRDATAPLVKDARIDAAPAPKLFVNGSGRCGECHEKMFDEWEKSAHADAASSALYKAAIAKAPEPNCGERCHTPLASKIGHDGIASEGVTCDVCHTLREPIPSVDGAKFRLAIDDMVKFGPRCDLKDHYFHRMGCSPEHTQAAICGSCHWWEPGGVPVFTEYKDWRDGPMGQAGKDGAICQDCHMPAEKAALATGSPVRQGVPHHGLLGLANDLRKRALTVEVAVTPDEANVAIAIALTNSTAGHHVPSGLPERRLLVRVRLVDDKGAQIEEKQWWLGRTLVDDTNTHVPFWKATKVGMDTRIAPGATWKESVTIGAPAGAGTVEVDVLYRGVAPAIAELLGLTEVEEHALANIRVPFGAPTATGRAKLPKTVAIKPSPPGKRLRPIKQTPKQPPPPPP